jgi:hypothetical protein
MENVMNFFKACRSRTLLAYTAIDNPLSIDYDHFVNVSIMTGWIFVIIWLLHHLVAVKFKKSYFACHVIVNAIVTFLVWEGALNALLKPTTSTVPLMEGSANSQLYLCWIFALHVYHPIFFKTGSMDWIHHVPVYICNLLMFGCLSSDVFYLQAIVMTGVPGGLDYLLLVILGEGYMHRATYKHYSAMINNWVRAPLGFVSGYVNLLGLYYQWNQSLPLYTPSHYQIFVYLIMGIHAMWNPPFFGRQAIEANILDTVNRFHLEHVPLKLPDIRKRSGECNSAEKKKK